MNVGLQLQCTRGGSRVEAGGKDGRKGAEEKGGLMYNITRLDEECKIWVGAYYLLLVGLARIIQLGLTFSPFFLVPFFLPLSHSTHVDRLDADIIISRHF